jgi:hypothetical protein
VTPPAHWLYRKKPVVIEARQITVFSVLAVAEWCGGQAVFRKLSDQGGMDCGIDVPTLEGVMHGAAGDWIIKGVKGEFYPCKPDIFEASYEPAAR